MTWLFALFQSKIARQIGGVILIVLGFLGARKYYKNEGANENNAKQERVDHENANDIRERVDAVDSVQDDQLEYRD